MGNLEAPRKPATPLAASACAGHAHRIGGESLLPYRMESLRAPRTNCNDRRHQKHTARFGGASCMYGPVWFTERALSLCRARESFHWRECAQGNEWMGATE